MLFPIEQLIKNREKPTCVRQDQTIREALALMLEREYSQLPVIDENGELIGLISDEVITHRYFHLRGEVPLLDLTVDHCLIPAVTLTKDRDIFEALDRLKDVYAIVIIEEDNSPTGILTEFDLAHFFRDLTEDLLIVEDIEISLRQIVERVLSSDQAMKTALINAHGVDSKEPGKPRVKFDEQTFGQLTNLINHPKNWHQFEDIFQPQDVFHRLMNEVRENRNQLAHFRGDLDVIQKSALKAAKQWLEARPKLKKAKVKKIQQVDINRVETARMKGGTDKYDAIKSHLEGLQQEGLSNVRMEFRDLETLLGFPLPESARKYHAWWQNDYHTHSHARSWMSAGWLAEDLDLNAEQISFRRTPSAKYPLFFDDLLKRFKKERPGITRAEKASIQNWFSFSSGVSGFTYGWVLPKEPVLRVELYIDTGDRDKNKKAFDRLWEKKSEIEAKLGKPLVWDRLNHAQACRIFLTRPFTFSDSIEDQEATKTWGVDTMLRFVEAFQPHIRTVL
jgi:hypothetical protein